MRKHNIFQRAALILLAVLLAIPPVNLKVYAAETDGVCPHCQQKVEWTAWDGTTTLAAGHYTLASDKVTVSTTKTLSSGDVVIDLDGKTMELASGKRKMFLVKDDAKLVFLDSSAEQTGTVISYQTHGYHAGMAQLQGGSMDIYGGTFKLREGGAAQRGGLFYIYKNTNTPTVNIYGGTFYGAKAYYATEDDGGGGIIYMMGANLNISGGTFYPGLDSMYGDTFCVNSASAKVTISGDPVIHGGFEVVSASSVKISGKPTILKGTQGCDYSLKLPASELLTVGALESGAQIGITADGVFTKDFTSAAAAEAAKGYFVSDDGGEIALEGSALKAVAAETQPTEPEVTEPTEPQPTQPGDKIYCPYGHTSHKGVTCDAELITWSEWTSTTSLPTTGSYYLSGDVTIKATSKPSGLNLDLNGCDVTRIIEVGDTDDCNVFSPVEDKVFVLTDTNAERHGILSVTWETGAENANAKKLGKVVKVSPNATMKMYGGIIDGSNITTNTRTETNGTVNVENGTSKNDAAFYMYGGKILGIQNYTIDAAGKKIYNKGSAIIARGGTTLEIYGGEIVGGESYNGACVHSASNKTKLMGGKYTGGTVSSSAAIVYVNANKITIGDVDMDGGVFIYKDAAMVTLVGSPKITNEGFSTYGICFGASSTGMIDATGIDSDARINIRSSRKDMKAPFAKVSEDLSGCFTVYNEGYRVQYNETDKTLYLDAYSPIETSACFCKDCKGETVPQWTVWDGATALSAGHYYLEKDTEMTASGMIDSAEAATVVLNLNGFALTKAAFRLQGKTNLVVMDSSAYATGTITGNGTIIVTESAESSAEIYGGAFSLSADAAKAANGALLYADKGSIKIAGGEFTGAAAEKGGVVAVNTGAALEITGGVFHPGTAANGDTLHAASGSTVAIGGTAQFEGGIEIAENVNVTISDTPVVRKLKGGSAYALKTASLMDVETLSVGARIFVTGTEKIAFGNVLTEEVTPDVIGRFFSADSENMKIVAEGNTLKLIPMVIDPEVIQQRRDIVESYMREQATMLWKATEDITYCFSRDTDDPSKASSSQLIHIKAGRIYRGLPYAYSYTTMTSFMDYAGEPDENGVYPISGLTYPAMSGLSTQTRMGNDCSSSVASSWSQIGASIYGTTSSGYVPRYGAVPVGDYIPLESYDDTNGTGTLVVVQNNGTEVMYESYAKLQKADALVRWKSANNHTMLVVSCKVVRNADGSINPTSSYVTVLEQTSSNVRNERTYQDPVLGTVYYIYGVDKQYSFKYLFDNTYIPMTCMELIDAAPVAAPVITDTQTEEHTVDNLFEGTINSTWLIDCVTVTITDEDGKVIQKAAQNAYRSRPREFVMDHFVSGKPEWTRGGIDTEALADGAYNCKVVCRLNTMEEFTVRDFAFTVGEAVEPEPTEPSVPTEPSEPTEPSVPTEPSEPTEPSVPTEPTEPEVQVIRGDMNGDGSVSDADAMYLLRYTLFGEGRYPLTQGGDVNGDGTVSDADAMYLLRFTLFGPSRYPLFEEVVSSTHRILNSDGSYGGSLAEATYGKGAPLNGEYDVQDSAYYTVNQDYYNMSSTVERVIFPKFATYQQTMQDSSGLACLLMALNYMGEDVQKEYTELALVKKYEEVNGTKVFGNGVTEEGLINLINSLNLGYTATNQDPAYSGGFTKDNTAQFFINAIKDGKFVFVRYQSPVGYEWKLVIGYDTLGNIKNTQTEEELDHFGDDVIIFAEPYDGYDHCQDGYATERAQDFYAWWKHAKVTGTVTDTYSYVIVDPNLDITFDYQSVDETVKQTQYEIHLPKNPDGTYGGTRDKDLYGSITSGRGWWNHPESNYYKINDFYNMGSEGTRILLPNYTVLQQTMSSSCGNCAVTGVLAYYGKDQRDLYDLELLYVKQYEETNGSKIKGNGTNGSGHKKALDAWGYTSTLKVATGASTNNGVVPFPTYESYMEFMRSNLSQGMPIVVATNFGSSHYLTVIGMDDMGTDYIYDDVIIVADSCDYWDGYQDGYNVYSAFKFYSQHTNGKLTQLQSSLVISK